MGLIPAFVRSPGAPKKRRLRRGPVFLAAPAFIAMAAAWAAPALPAAAPSPSWSTLASRAILAEGAAAAPAAWNVETGLRLKALEAEWYNTARGDDFEYARRTVDGVLANPDWNAPGHSPYADALLGQQLMLLYRVTLKPAYYSAARELWARLAPSCGLPRAEPGTPQALQAPMSSRPCIAQAFLAEYAAEFQRPQDFPVLAQSFGSRTLHNQPTQPMPITAAQDSLFALSWSAASLVDSLSCFPQTNPSRAQALSELHAAAARALRAEARQNGSHTADWLLTYAFLKGVRLHELPASYRANAVGLWRDHISVVRNNSDGRLSFTDSAAGDGLGAFLLASTEVDIAPGSTASRGAVILLDAWYNSQQRKNAAGQMQSYHYKWSDWSDSGYAIFGHMLRSAGLKTETLTAEPTPQSLLNAGYYLIISPDNPAKNPHPHYMTGTDAEVIVAWVRHGGILILMENDPPNADIPHLNLLADPFGIHFENVLHHHVVGEDVKNGRIPVSGGGPLFQHAHTLYMKDTCAITLRVGAVPLLRDRGDVVMAAAHYGRGVVFAAVDPWLYNEYTDGRKQPAAVYRQFDNFAGGEELVRWLVQQGSQSHLRVKGVKEQ